MSSSYHRFLSLVEREKLKTMEATSPAGHYLVAKTGQLIERVTQYQKMALRESDTGIDPRSKLRGN